LVNVCSVINKFVFIILNNQIINLKIDVTFLDTNWGKKVKNILEHINIEGQIDNFYFELPKMAA
jgi:hypothetical protein